MQRAPKHGPKKHAIELADDDDDEDVATLPRKKKRKSFLKRISLDQEERPEEQSKDALRLQELQQQAMKAFLDDEDDDDEDEDSDLEDENDVHVKSSPVRVRAPGVHPTVPCFSFAAQVHNRAQFLPFLGNCCPSVAQPHHTIHTCAVLLRHLRPAAIQHCLTYV